MEVRPSFTLLRQPATRTSQANGKCATTTDTYGSYRPDGTLIPQGMLCRPGSAHWEQR